MKLFTFKRLRIAALILALLPVLANTSAQGENWPSWMKGAKGTNEFESQLSMARLNERHGQHDAAMKIYNSVLVKQPNNPIANHRLAVIAASNGDYAASDQHFAAAMKAGPPTAELMGDLGYSLFLQNRLDEAEESLRKTLTKFPTYKRAHNTLGMVLGLKGQYEEALSEFRQVVGEAEAHANLAFAMVQVGDLQQANRHYHEAVKLDPTLRSAVEALVQLNGQMPAESSPSTAKPVTAGKSDTAAPTNENARSRSMAKQPGATREARFTPKQPQSLQASTPMNQPVPVSAKNSSPAADESTADRGKADFLTSIAQPSVPPTPVVPTQSEFSFGPAVIGLAKKDLAHQGIQATATAHDHMMVDRTPDKQMPSSQIAASDIKQPELTAISTEQADSSTSGLFGSATAFSPAAETASGKWNSADATRAQVVNYAPPMTQVSISDDPTETPAVVLAPGAYALAAARAQADLLAKENASSPTAEPGIVPAANIKTIPLPPAMENVNRSQAQAIPVNIAATDAAILQAGFSIAPAAIASQDSENTTSETLNSPEVSPSVQGELKSLGEVASPSPWQIVALTLAGVFCLVSLGKTVRYLGRHGMKAQNAEPVVPAVPRSIEAHKYDVEESYSYLEGQIREVCAGLPASRRNAAGSRQAS